MPRQELQVARGKTRQFPLRIFIGTSCRAVTEGRREARRGEGDEVRKKGRKGKKRYYKMGRGEESGKGRKERQGRDKLQEEERMEERGEGEEIGEGT